MKKLISKLLLITSFIALGAFAADKPIYSGKAKLRMQDVYCIAQERFTAIQNLESIEGVTDAEFALRSEIQISAYETQILNVYGLAYKDQNKAYGHYETEQKAHLVQLRKWVQHLKESKISRDEMIWLFNSELDVMSMKALDQNGNAPACESNEAEHGSGRPGKTENQ